MARAFGGRVLAPDDERALAREDLRICFALFSVIVFLIRAIERLRSRREGPRAKRAGGAEPRAG